ncbi:ShlB/FhaC/HecB family hemolysin secretion/activation protein [Pacificimonas sp. ICDLI1SI03]
MSAYAQDPSALDPMRIEEGIAELESQLNSPPPRQNMRAADLQIAPFILSGVQVLGREALDPAAVAAAYEPYLATLVGTQELSEIISAVGEAYQAAGHTLTRVYIPPQTLSSGILRLQVEEGRLGELRITRDGQAAPEYARFFRSTSAEGPLGAEQLKSAVLALEDLPEVNAVDATLVPDAVLQSVYRLDVEITPQDAGNYVVLDGYGSKSVGPLRAYGLFSANRLLLPGDEWKLRLVTVPDRPNEFLSAEIDGAFAADGKGNRIGFNLGSSRIEPQGVNGVGRSVRGGVRWEMPLARERESGTWLNLGLDLRDNDFERDGRMAREDSIRAARIGIFTYKQTEEHRVRANVALSQGLPILGASVEGDELSSRINAEPAFTIFRMNASYRRSLSPEWRVEIGGTGQMASGPLLSSEQFFLGGAVLGHAFDDGDIAGDMGIGGSAEVSNVQSLSGGKDYLILSALVEAGLADYRMISGLPAQSLSSASVGARWLTGDLDLGAELAVPLHIDSLFVEKNAARLRFRLIYRI